MLLRKHRKLLGWNIISLEAIKYSLEESERRWIHFYPPVYIITNVRLFFQFEWLNFSVWFERSLAIIIIQKHTHSLKESSAVWTGPASILSWSSWFSGNPKPCSQLLRLQNSPSFCTTYVVFHTYFSVMYPAWIDSVYWAIDQPWWCFITII